MPRFVIAGKPNCKDYTHAKHVGTYLNERLIDFELHTIEKKIGEWEPWLENINKTNGWYHTKSPIIWKELCSRGGRAYLIGNLNEFWEYCYDYYGLESMIATNELTAMADDYVKYLEESQTTEKVVDRKILNICITGASNPIMELLLPELCQLKEFICAFPEMHIRLYDRYADSPENYTFLKNLKENISNLVLQQSVTLNSVALLSDGLSDCDLLIIADCIKSHEYSSTEELLVKKMSTMLHYADEINTHAKRNLRVILIDNDFVCFCATILVESCTRIRVSNIVAVTSDVGLSYLSTVAKHTGIPLGKLSGPPVWGFIGVNEFVDLESIIKYSEIYIPYARSFIASGDSALPKGKMKPELRFLSYSVENCEQIIIKTKMRRGIMMDKLITRPVYAKVRATISLLKLWYSEETPDDIISLGLCSNGSFGLPNGIVFSQPVALNDLKMWQPFKNFPLRKKADEQIKKLISPVKELLESFGVATTYTEYT